MVVAAVVAGTAAAVQASQQGPPVDVSIKIQSTLPQALREHSLVTAPTWDPAAAVEYADATWNCAGGSPPCPGCADTVPTGSDQSPYGCAPYVAHIITAGGVDTGCDKCTGDMDCFSAVERDGKTYDLNVVGSKDANCDSTDGCLMDFLLAKGWVEVNVSEVDAGVVCAVDGGDNFNEPWGHIVFGVEPGLINAHNVARRHQSIDVYDGHVRLCLKNKHYEASRKGEQPRGESNKQQ
jgi:hypothetical protein